MSVWVRYGVLTRSQGGWWVGGGGDVVSEQK